ncbi:radical SAM protein [Bradyrhizobium sp. BR 10261]|uniref:radical SAM protein n=1 Tax=Bradyrhizobium sp. BR 10261 TaxID=2749992 RepID=UPI001C65214B|nr:radical SAM protein [Bradyrhizobium sp. BR 10261]MBW7967162.1 radical SAM protein [Bradyrhizobium sp. BR 10261]
MFELANLEIHAWDGCNLSCESCSHYSSLGLRGGPSDDDCRNWMMPWSSRLRPKIFSIVGGEPTLNPNLAEIVQSVGELWPDSRIRLVTNGFLLKRHPKLPEIMAPISERAYIEVSSHHGGAEYQSRFAPVRDICAEWQQRFGLDIRIRPADARWTRRYWAAGSSVTFPDGEPRAAWEACEGKRCRQIFEGQLWKCPPIAYFELLAKSNQIDERWIKLAHSYKALDPACSDEELTAFLSREEEEVCRLCPSKLEPFELQNPLLPRGQRRPEQPPRRLS